MPFGGYLLGAYFFRIAWLAMAAALCLASMPDRAAFAASGAKDAQPMRFVLVRGTSAQCAPECPEWISAEGEIRADTPAKLRKILKQVGHRQMPIIVQSPGGSVEAALAMGRMIRERKLAVAVAYTRFFGCAPWEKGCQPDRDGYYRGATATGFAYCNSACPLMLAGGVRRLVGTWAHLGVHQVTTIFAKQKIFYQERTKIVKGKKVTERKIIGRKQVGTFKTYEMDKALRARLAAYLKEMDVSVDLLVPMEKTPVADVFRIEQVELLRLRLVTGMETASALTEPGVCRGTPMPSNCRLDFAEMPLSRIPLPTSRPDPAASFPPPMKPRHPLPSIDNDMQFFIVRGTSPLCEPACPEWIAAEGWITPQTPGLLRALLDTRGKWSMPVLLVSRGGDAGAAMEMGKLFHQHQLDVAVARSNFIRCVPWADGCLPDNGAYAGVADDNGAECRQECLLILAAGISRYAGSHVRISTERNLIGPAERAYLAALGHPTYLIKVLAAGPIRSMDASMQQRIRLTNGFGSSNDIAGVHACTRPGPRCRVLASSSAASH